MFIYLLQGSDEQDICDKPYDCEIEYLEVTTGKCVEGKDSDIKQKIFICKKCKFSTPRKVEIKNHFDTRHPK